MFTWLGVGSGKMALWCPTPSTSPHQGADINIEPSSFVGHEPGSLLELSVQVDNDRDRKNDTYSLYAVL